MAGSGSLGGGRLARTLAACLLAGATLLPEASTAATGAPLPDSPPFTVTTYCGPTPCVDQVLAVEGSRAFLAGTHTLAVVDISDPATPVPLSELTLAYTSDLVVGDEGYAYGASALSSARSQLFVLDVSDPTAPQIVSTRASERVVQDLALGAGRLLVADAYDGLRVYDVSDPTALAETARLDAEALFGEPASVEAQALAVEGSYAFVAASVSVTSSPALDLQTLLAVVDIGNPDAPVVVGRYTEPRANSVNGSVGGLDVVEGRAYLVKRGALRILDVSQPAQPRLEGSFLPSSVYADQLMETVVVGGVAYIANWQRTLRVVDVADPTAPVDLGYERPTPGTNNLAVTLAVSDGFAFVGVGQSGVDVIAVDGDRDGITARADNCPATENADQADTDGDGEGDVCDVCPAVGFVSPDDSDLDGWADYCDLCPADFDPAQTDSDGDGVGDACNAAEDADGDEHADGLDNCPGDANADQADFDHDGFGDVCDPFPFDADHERAALERDLALAQARIAEVEDELGVCLARGVFVDADEDGEEDGTDACPATAPGATTDAAGCSQAQFCAGDPIRSLSAAFACVGSDWRNDQPMEFFPGDCRVSLSDEGLQGGFVCRGRP